MEQSVEYERGYADGTAVGFWEGYVEAFDDNGITLRIILRIWWTRTWRAFIGKIKVVR